MQHKPCRGFTILEILIAMMILGGAIAVIGELARSGFRAARNAQLTTQAELLAESVLAQVRIGIIGTETVVDQPISAEDFLDTGASDQGRGEPLWLYSIDVQTIDEDGLLELAVTVRQNVPEEQRPVACRLVRWLVDPSFDAEEAEEEEEEEETTPETAEDLP